MWLYAYEASRKGWTGLSSSFLASNPQFSELAKRQISFYNENKNFLRASRKIDIERRNREKEKIAFSKNLDEAALDLLEQFDEYDFSDPEPMVSDDFYAP